jgi:hypothetical protein
VLQVERTLVRVRGEIVPGRAEPDEQGGEKRRGARRYEHVATASASWYRDGCHQRMFPV